MKMTLPKSTISNINTIFILDCLRNDELQTGRHCEEQIVDLLSPVTEKNENRVYRESCFDSASFYNIMNKISLFCREGNAPLIHIHGHGHENKGLQLTKEFISWYDLMEKLREITINASGETTVIASFCHSFNIVNEFLDEYEKQKQVICRLPFGFFYGYHGEISAGIIEKETKYINESILNDGGKAIMDNLPKYISSYSEYDYINEKIALWCQLISQKEPNSPQIINDLSLGVFRKELLNKSKDWGIPFSFSREFFNNLRDNLKAFLKKLTEDVMYDTERKQKYLEAIDKITFN